jgi:hypothetical protein
MLRIPNHIVQLARAATWRQALVSVLIVLMTFAPIARAACDYEHVADIGHSSGTDTQAASGATDNPDSSDLESCCNGSVHAISEHARTAAVDASVGPGTPTLHTLSTASASLSQYRVRLDPIRRQHPLPPVEPAFRRVPKLLI